MADLPRLLVCSFDVVPSPTAASRRLTEYLRGLSERFQVSVLSVKTSDHSHIERYEGARLLRVPVGQGDLPSRLLAFDRAVRRQLESEEYALVHCFDPFSGYPVCEAKALHAYKVVYEAERFPSHELPALQPSIASDTRLLSKLRRHELFCLMNAEAVITGSEVTRHYLRSLGVPDSVIHTVRAPVDLAGYAKVSAPSEEARLLRLVHLSGRAAFDDVDTVLDGLAKVKGKAAVELRVIGAPPAEGTSTWEARAWEKGVDGLVKLLPPVAHAELPLVLSDADLCLVPLADVERNRDQGSAVASLSEYLAAGRPVLAADLPAVRERVSEEAAVFYPPGDSGALAERLLALANDGPGRVRRARKAKQLAAAVDGARVREAQLALYGELMGLDGPPPKRPDTWAPAVTGNGPPSEVPNDELNDDEPSFDFVPSAPMLPAKLELPKIPQATFAEPAKLPGRAPLTAPLSKPGPPVTDPIITPELARRTALIDTAAKLDASKRAAPVEPPAKLDGPNRAPAVVPGKRTTPVESPTPKLGGATAPAERSSAAPNRWETVETPAPKLGPAFEPSAPAPSVARRSETIGPPAPKLGTSLTSAPLEPASPASATKRSETIETPVPKLGTPPPSAPFDPASPVPSVARRAEAIETPASKLGVSPRSNPVEAPSPASAAARRSETIETPAPTLDAPVRSPISEVAARRPPTTEASGPAKVEVARIPRPGGEPSGPPPIPSRPSLPPVILSRPPSEASLRRDTVPTGMPAVALDEAPAPPRRADTERQMPAVVAPRTFTPTTPAAPIVEEPEEISADEVVEAGEAQVPAPPPSALNPWFAQLVHGYCPPEATHFARHTPPTNFPGREGPVRTRTPESAPKAPTSRST